MKTTSLLSVVALAASIGLPAAQASECDNCPLPLVAVESEPAEYRSTLFDRSEYTHAPHTDHRVAQFLPKQPAYRPQGYYERSAFRYNQSTIGRGNHADRLNVVETWGRGAEIRPYGEWERPYRRGARPIWETDPQAYFYGTYPYPYLSENRSDITFENRGRDRDYDRGRDDDRRDDRRRYERDRGKDYGKYPSKHDGGKSKYDKH